MIKKKLPIYFIFDELVEMRLLCERMCIVIRKRISYFICLLLFSSQAIVWAAPPWGYPTTDFEITSPFGWRIHPISGKGKGHAGVDLATASGTDVVSVDDGVVLYVDWDENGYGNFVVIDHGNGLTTWYGHNRDIVIREGTRVSKGTLIAHCGSTGGSTGPHVHFEVRLNGVPQDPAPYLDPSIPMPINAKTGMLPDGTLEFLNSETRDFEWDENYYVNFGDKAKKFSDDIVGICVSGMAALQGPVRSLFIMLITIDLAMSAMFNLFEDQENVLEWLLKRFLKYGFLLWVITDWKTLVPELFLGYFATVGGLAGGADAATAGMLMSDTTVMMQKGAYLAGPAFAHASKIHGMAVMMSPGDLIVSLILGFSILICFIIMALEVMFAYLEFYIVSTLSVVMFAFSGLKQTEKYGENSWKGVFQVSMKVMLFCFFSMMMNQIVEGTAQVAYDPVVYLKMLLGSLSVLMLSIRLSSTLSKVFR